MNRKVSGILGHPLTVRRSAPARWRVVTVYCGVTPCARSVLPPSSHRRRPALPFRMHTSRWMLQANVDLLCLESFHTFVLGSALGGSQGYGREDELPLSGPTVSKFRERAATGATRLTHSGRVMVSAPVARLGYDGFQRNRRVVIAGARNALMARVAPYLPRTFALRVVHNMLEPART
jgi:hypothetical protein